MTKSPSQTSRVLFALAAAGAACSVGAHRWHIWQARKRLSEGVLRGQLSTVRSPNSRVGDTAKPPRVDAQFVKNLIHFVKVAVPSFRSSEFVAVVAVAALLAARSWLDLWASANGGRVVKAIVGRNRRMFIRTAILDIASMMFPMALVNNSLRYMLSTLTVMMRRRISLYFHDKYLSSNTFYKVSNLDARIRNVDQHLTVDIDRFCSSLAELYSNLTKPAIDIYLFSRRLAKSLGPQGPILMISYFGLCSAILQALQPPFGQLAAEEQKLEGEYRLHHSRLITHSEEIAFFRGGPREKQYINTAFNNVVAHLKRVFATRWRIGVIDAILVKYIATIVGYTVVSIPVFFSHTKLYKALLPTPLSRKSSDSKASSVSKNGGTADETTSASEIAGLYTRNSRLLLQLAGAIGRLVLAGKEINRMTGFCQRITKLRDVLDDLSRDGAVRKRFESSPDLERDLKLAQLMQLGRTVVGSEDGGDGSQNTVRFEGINLISPDATILVENLNFEIPRGCHVLTTGPNGSGKSSMFRVLAGLWPIYGGTVYRPARSRIFYVPQRPYLALGTLRENVTYPMNWQEAVEQRGATDETIVDLLKTAHLESLVKRDGGIDAVQDWAEVLSGGQKQRLGFARLLFHRPDYAILDEASSAVSIDIEALLYQSVKAAGITLISVSHRPSLWNFHDKVLAFDGSGGYEFRDIQPDDIPVMIPPSIAAVGSSSPGTAPLS